MTVTTPPDVPTLGMPDDDVVDALLAGVVRVRRRAEIYESDGVTKFDIDGWDGRLTTGGNITVDMGRDERRMCDLTFDNEDNALQVNPVNGFWYDKIVKCFWGINYYNSAGLPKSWDTQVGEFMIDRISEDHFPDTVKVTGRDYTKKCLVSKLKFSVQFAKFTPVETMIRNLAANAGVTKFALPVTGQVYDVDAVYERGTDRWKIIKEIAESVGYEVFFRADGYLTMRPWADPIYSPLAWIFRPGALDGSLVSYTRSTNDSRIKNHVIVTGAKLMNQSGFNETIFAEALNNDTGSPTRIDRIGDRTEFINSDYITTTEQAQLLAAQRLRISALEEYEISFESLVLPWLDVSSIVDIWQDRIAPTTPQRFLLSQLNLSMDLGTMSGTGRRVTIVGSDQTLEYA